MPAHMTQCQCVRPNVNVYEPTPTFWAEHQCVGPAPTSRTQKRHMYDPTPVSTNQHRRFEPNASVYDQHRRLEPNTGVYGPRTLFRAKRRRVQPNASELHMASTWWEPCGIDIIGVPNRS